MVIIDNPKIGCWRRFKGEICIPFFALEEPGGFILDLNECFRAGNPLVSFIIWGFIVSNLIYTWITFETSPVWWFLAYLSTWVQIMASLYQTFSLLNNWFVDSILLMKLTWVMFPVTVVHAVIEILTFWIWEYVPSENERNYPTLFTHGFILLMLLLDGLGLNRTPVRLNHWFFVLIFSFMYVSWIVVQNTFLHYNPYEDDDDDAIYDELKWQTNRLDAIYTAVVVVFGVSPAIHLILWGLSLAERCYELEPDSDGQSEEEINARGSKAVSTGGNRRGSESRDAKCNDDSFNPLECITFSNSGNGNGTLS